MNDVAVPGRPNQKRRTRKDLLQAAARLAAEGRKPSLEEIAEEALVSRATAYRYFPSVDALMVEAALDMAFPDAALLDRAGGDPAARLIEVDDAIAAMMETNETLLRTMLAHALQQSLASAAPDAPARQNRRMPLIEAALAPAQKEFKCSDFETLKRALALILGTEAMIVFKDVLQLDAAEARKVRRWAIRALVEAARTEKAAR
ncbi:MAG: TetR/AcrR family transcriptional regulator [Hyphomonadaceae bacterium]